ncbi:hypothetical protein [Paenibacillus sp. DMB20]|nr:hypothetical protein [Paenibacillus sp. DMB20]
MAAVISNEMIKDGIGLMEVESGSGGDSRPVLHDESLEGRSASLAADQHF